MVTKNEIVTFVVLSVFLKKIYLKGNLAMTISSIKSIFAYTITFYTQHTSVLLVTQLLFFQAETQKYIKLQKSLKNRLFGHFSFVYSEIFSHA